MKFIFILVKPENSKNIGAAARAMKTMGHSDLRIVGPAADHLNGQARALAHNSNELLEEAVVFESLEQATQDCDIVIGTTARHRKAKLRYFDVGELQNMILDKKDLVKKVGLVFGGETSGLSNDDLLFCDIAASIPIITKNPSLNLAQSVMIFSYEMSQMDAMHITDRRIDHDEASPLEYATLKQGILELIDSIDFPQKDRVKHYVATAITRLGYDDLYLLHNLRKRISSKIKNLENGHD